MGWSGIERNRLDYILTDLLPVELSELFSFTQFYSYLLNDDQQKLLKDLVERLRVAKASKTNQRMFDSGWNTVPLKYRILKGTETMREMSVIQPLSALNVFFFIECYQKELLDFFEKNNKFSIRYHRKNSNLYYKTGWSSFYDNE